MRNHAHKRTILYQLCCCTMIRVIIAEPVAQDNVRIERFRRIVMREYVYLNPMALGSKNTNNYLGAKNERSICRALPSEGSASNTRLT